MTLSSRLVNSIGRSEFSRYFWAGSLTFVVDLSILILLTEVGGLNYLWSNLISVSVGILLSYLLSVKWIFLDRRYNRVVFEFPLFVLICVVGIILNESLLWACVEFGKMHYLAAKVVVTVVIFAFNFCVKKIVLFRR